jgi:hypothetical protein
LADKVQVGRKVRCGERGDEGRGMRVIGDKREGRLDI